MCPSEMHGDSKCSTAERAEREELVVGEGWESEYTGVGGVKLR